MTDRELLEFAAKAAGLTINAARQAERDKHGFGPVGLWTEEGTAWNPLTDDGDALRLAVKLSMTLRLQEAANGWFIAFAYTVDTPEIEQWGEDHFAATRRAIVRAAAAIGVR